MTSHPIDPTLAPRKSENPPMHRKFRKNWQEYGRFPLRSWPPSTGAPSGPGRKVPQRLEKKKEPKPKLFGPDIFGWGGGLSREGVGAKKFGMSFETQGNQTFWRDIPGFCRDISLRKKKTVFNSCPLHECFLSAFGHLAQTAPKSGPRIVFFVFFSFFFSPNCLLFLDFPRIFSPFGVVTRVGCLRGCSQIKRARQEGSCAGVSGTLRALL